MCNAHPCLHLPPNSSFAGMKIISCAVVVWSAACLNSWGNSACTFCSSLEGFPSCCLVLVSTTTKGALHNFWRNIILVWPSRSRESLCSHRGICVLASLDLFLGLSWRDLNHRLSQRNLYILHTAVLDLLLPCTVLEGFASGTILEGSPSSFAILVGRASSMYHIGGVCIIHTPSQKDLHLPHAIPEGSAASLCHLGGVCIILSHLGGLYFFPSWDILEGSAWFLHHIWGICCQAILMGSVELSSTTHRACCWLGTKIISCASYWGPELSLGWSQQGHPSTSLAGS
jgi:hypothetical protein